MKKRQRLYGLFPLACLPFAAVAGAPTIDSNWQVNAGVITTGGCPVGFSCAPLNSSAGFLQMRVTDNASGTDYIKTFIADKNATGTPGNLNYSSVGIVKITGGENPVDNGLGGLAFKATSNAPELSGSVQISSGWAAPSGNAKIDIVQKIAEPGRNIGDEFDSVTNIAIESDAAGNVVGRSMAISQNIGLGWPKTTTLEDESNNSISTITLGQLHPTERQVFALREGEGTLALPTGKVYRLWIYHWQSTGLDPRDGSPLRGQWFTCQTPVTSGKSGCNSWSKSDSNPVPSVMGTLPFNAPMELHNRQKDQVLYPSNAKGNDNLTTVPDPATGGPVWAPPAPLPPPPIVQSPSGSGSPVPFGGWTEVNGVVSVNCPANFTCTTVASGKGFAQLKLTDTRTSKSYFQMVVTGGPTGTSPGSAFSNESIVLAGQMPAQFTTPDPDRVPQTPTIQSGTNNSSGIANRTLISDSADAMSSASVINTGWATAAGVPSIQLSQSSSFTTFEYAANRDANDKRTGYKLKIIQDARSLPGDSDWKLEWLEKQRFTHMAIGGDMLTAAGSTTFPGGRSLAWKPGDAVTVTMMLQNVNGGIQGRDARDPTGNTAVDWNQGWGGPKVGYIAYDNLSDTQDPMGIVSPKNPIPNLWETELFGLQPFE